MPPVTTQSTLIKKLGARLATAHEQHKDDETTFSGGGELPPGIENGIAQLVECKFGYYEKGDAKGEPFFYAAGVVQQPKKHSDGRKLEGLRTSIMEPLYDTPKRSRKTVEEHLAWIYNEMRKLGVNTSELDPANLEATAEALKQAKPYFSFRTWAGSKQDIEQRAGKFWVGDKSYPTEQAAKTAHPFAGKDPMTSHTWNGVMEYEAPDDGGGVEDESGAAEAEPEPESKPNPTPVKTATKPPVATKAPAKKPEPPPEELNEFGDIDSVLEMANAGDEASIQRLTEMALAAGATQKEVDGAADWNAVGEMVKNPRSAPEEDDSEPEPEEYAPKLEDVHKYQPNDPKTKKPAINPKTKKPLLVEVEVIAVNEGAKTVDLKNLDDGKTKYTKVPWASLLPNS